MKTFRSHLKNKVKDSEFKELYDKEQELLEISIRLLQTRKQLGLSQQQLSRKAHITQQQLSKVENGINCNMETFLKVCHALNMKIDLENQPII